jgi:hypothetical protein
MAEGVVRRRRNAVLCVFTMHAQSGPAVTSQLMWCPHCNSANLHSARTTKGASVIGLRLPLVSRPLFFRFQFLFRLKERGGDRVTFLDPGKPDLVLLLLMFIRRTRPAGRPVRIHRRSGSRVASPR